MAFITTTPSFPSLFDTWLGFRAANVEDETPAADPTVKARAKLRDRIENGYIDEEKSAYVKLPHHVRAQLNVALGI